MRYFQYYSISAAAIFIGTLFACSQKTEDKKESTLSQEATDIVVLTSTQQKNINIKTGFLEEREISSSIQASGKLEAPPQNLVTISAPFAGFVQTMDLLQGMEIKKGQAVVVLQHPDYIQLQQDYLDTKSQLEFLDMEYKRQQELSKENINSVKSVQSARANFLSAKAKVQGMAGKLKLMNLDIGAIERGEFTSTIKIYSPIDGFVTDIRVNIGQFVNPNDVILKIVNTHHLHVELKIFEKDVFKVKKGQKILFTLAGDNVKRSATVYLIGRDISEDRSITIHGHLSEEHPQLLPGMYLTGEIEINPTTVKVLPEQAVVSHEGKAFVFLEGKQGQYKIMPVTTGISENGFVEVIFQQQPEGKTPIVVSGAYGLLGVLKNGAAN